MEKPLVLSGERQVEAKTFPFTLRRRPVQEFPWLLTRANLPQFFSDTRLGICN
jgi:hypothetical protein